MDMCGLLLGFLYHAAWTNVGILVNLGYLSAILETKGYRVLTAVAMATTDSYALVCAIDAVLNNFFFLIHFLFVAAETSKMLG